MARPEAEGLKWDNCFAGRAGLDILFAGPGLIIQFAGRAPAGSAQMLRARAGHGSQIISIDMICRA